MSDFTPETTDDLFADLSKLRMTQDFISETGVKKVTATVPCRKPHKQDFIRVHPDPAYRETMGLIQIGTDREFYLVSPTMAGELAGEFAPYTLYTCVNRQEVAFIWPVRVQGPDDKPNEWWRSAHEAASEAVTSWTRVTPNMSLGAYEIRVAPTITAEPAWPELSFNDLLRIAFRDKVISSSDHEVVRKLRGLV
jgi:hypothetical protein